MSNSADSQRSRQRSEVDGKTVKSAESSPLTEGLDLELTSSSDHQSGDLSIPVLTDIHESRGIQFVYDNGASRLRRMNESTGGGAGWLDVDNDGLADLYCVQGGNSDGAERSENPADQLFRNRGETFDAVGEVAGLTDRRYGHGVSVADFDGDGFDDIYVTNVGLDRLYHNQGDGTFIDVTAQAGTVNYLWAASAAWSDLNSDGLLDLYVCNYVEYDPANPIACYDDQGDPRICHPDGVDPVANRFFVNQGNGQFTESLATSGLAADHSKSLGVVIADFNGDRTPDIFVANDTTYNHLFLNDGRGNFRENAVASGCAVSGRGQFQASMGVAFGDYNQDGNWDLYVTHFTSDSNTLYRGLGRGTFHDATREELLHQPTLAYLGFGAVFVDLNCSGTEDLFIANGHVDDKYAADGELWKMPSQLFVYNGTQWMDSSSQAGPYFQQPFLGRAVAVGDLDNDGYPELIVIHQRDNAAVLKSEQRDNNWLNLSFVSDSYNRRAIGAVATVTQGSRKQMRAVVSGTSYCASHQHRLFFGFGANAADCQVHILWPDGHEQVLEHVRLNQHLVIQDRGP